jgi:PAS domain S-box-containing protein
MLSDPRLAPYATGDVPVWLWSPDATRVLWGNPVAAAIFNAASSAALAGHTIDPKGSAALQVARLAGTLPHGATPRLERLRGFGGRMGGALLCGCSRITLANGMPGILVVASEAAGPRLTLEDQAKRLLSGCDEPAALFAADGTLLYATPAAQNSLGRIATLQQLGAEPLAATALATGRAEGNSRCGKVSIQRLGGGSSTVMLTRLVAATTKSQDVPAAPPAAAQAAAPSAPPAMTEAATQPAAAAPAPAPTPPPGSASPAREPSPDRTAPRRVAAARPAPPQTERRQPLRFVWQVDADGRFTINSDEFIALIGPRVAAALGQPWTDIAAELGLDPEGHVARAFASRETWSGIVVSFPVNGHDVRLAVEMSGLPVFDRERNFRGYRGFGICRDTTRVAELSKTQSAPQPPARPRAEPPVFREPMTMPVAATAPENVVAFPSPSPAEPSPELTAGERKAFSELASRLSARLRANREKREKTEETPLEPADQTEAQPGAIAAPPAKPSAPAQPRTPASPTAPSDQRPILDRLPIGVLVYRLDKLIYANRAFLDWTGYGQLHDLQEAGGLDALFVEPSASEPATDNGAQSLTIATNRGDQLPVAARLFTSPWEGESALLLMLTGIGSGSGGNEQQTAIEAALRSAKSDISELRSILDAAADGVVVIDGEARVDSVSASAEALFGYRPRELIGLPFTTLFAQESQRAAIDAIANPDQPGPSAQRNGRDVIGRASDGGLVSLFMTVSRLGIDSDKLCAVFRDITAWKKTESELLNAKRQAEKASTAKSDFLAKVSHEIRTPLNAIIGFSEVMMQERFGPIGNNRYKQYLADIHSSGDHLISLLNDLLDLSKIEAGRLDLKFANVDLNEVTQQGVTLMQPQANRGRIIIRTSLPGDLPQVTADVRSVRQIVLNLLSNSIKFTGAGGQVIVSTARSDDGDVVLRVRDTGVGMSEYDIAIAMEPFRQLATSAHWGSGGSGLGLPLTKALAEANRARFRIRSAVNTGTLVEVAFPGPRMAAE